MKFYDRQNRHYCGIELHVKTMYVCILGASGQVFVHRNVKRRRRPFSSAMVLRMSRSSVPCTRSVGRLMGFRGSLW